MIRKTIISLCLTLVSLAAAAQTAVGTWTHLPYYSGKPDKVIAGAERTYYICGRQLYSYDPIDEVFTQYSSKLHSNSITASYYTPEGGYLALGFEDGNIDIIYDADHRIVNLSDVRDAPVGKSKQINDFEHHDGRLYVACDFGLVIYDMARGVVTQSGNYDKAVKLVSVANNHVALLIDNQINWAPIDGRLNRLDVFNVSGGGLVYQMLKIDDNSMACLRNDQVYVLGYDPVEKKQVYRAGYTDAASTAYLMAGTDGVYGVSSNKIYRYNTDGSRDVVADMPAALQGQSYGIYDGIDDLWAAGDDGLGLYDITSGSVVTKAQPSKPEAAIPLLLVQHIIPSRDGKTLYFCNAGTNNIDLNTYMNTKACIIRLRDGVWTDVSPDPAQNVTSFGGMVEDPDDDSVIWVVTGWKGLWCVRDGEVIAHYNRSNMFSGVGDMLFGINVDDYGNLWLAGHHADGVTGVNMIPSESRAKYTGLTASDLVPVTDAAEFSGLWQASVLPLRQNPGVFVAGFNYGNPVVAINTNGTATASDDRAYCNQANTDSDGKRFSYSEVLNMVEDKNGQVWFQHKYGVSYLPDPTQALNGVLTPVRPKVPRNDGTLFADYLLDGEELYCMAVDGENHKWFGSSSSGLYCVSEDGTQIIEHHHTDNSMLTTNQIRSVYADPNSNLIYVGTQYGLFAYASTSIAGAGDLDNVYAYPNPVRPEYSGWITVTGLMDGSLVKIADMSGNVVHSGRSEGGMYVWDGCNNGGGRVKSGVYVVFASRTGQDGTGAMAAVTKILIMN